MPVFGEITSVFAPGISLLYQNLPVYFSGNIVGEYLVFLVEMREFCLAVLVKWFEFCEELRKLILTGKTRLVAAKF